LAVCDSLKSFKDPVHGYVDLCAKLKSVVDHWILQRLRGIRQTGFAYLVYHGMEHSRFNHSLGTAHLARETLTFLAANTRLYYRDVGGSQFAESLMNSVEVFQLAALVHDVGHLPFSHASEGGIVEARRIFNVREFESLPLRHEEYTYSLLGHIAAIAEEAAVEPKFTGSVHNDLHLILHGHAGRPLARSYESECVSHVLHQLIAGGLDVDRMDYLLRDSIYAGVRYGVFDVDRLVRVLIATPLLLAHESDEEGLERRISRSACQVAILDKGLSILETFFLARFYMFSEVYLHRVVEAYNSMYARLLALLAADGVVAAGSGGGELSIPPPSRLSSGSSSALEAWRELDDAAMISLMRSVARGRVAASGEARRLAEMLLSRRHLKVYRVCEDKMLWGLYSDYLYKNAASPELKPLLDELIELQRENPLLIIKPLRIDVVSFERLNVYIRSNGTLVDLAAAARDEGHNRIDKLAQLGIYRIAVFTEKGREELADKVIEKLKGIAEEAAKLEKR
jgi:HD superfamily phosphohydrolase